MNKNIFQINKRQDIRKAIKALIEEATDLKCFVGRTRPLQAQELPAITLASPLETTQTISNDQAQSRSLDLLIKVILDEEEPLDSLDCYANCIENALLLPEHRFLGRTVREGPANQVDIGATEVSQSRESELFLSVLTMNIRVQYFSQPEAEEARAARQEQEALQDITNSFVHLKLDSNPKRGPHDSIQ